MIDQEPRSVFQLLDCTPAEIPVPFGGKDLDLKIGDCVLRNTFR